MLAILASAAGIDVGESRGTIVSRIPTKVGPNVAASLPSASSQAVATDKLSLGGYGNFCGMSDYGAG